MKKLSQLVCFLLIFKASVITGLKCKCNICGTDTSVCEGSSFFSVCEIYRQQDQLFQACSSSFGGCSGTIIENPGSSRPFYMCCVTDSCNSNVTIFDHLLTPPAVSSTKIISPSSSTLSSSVISPTTSVASIMSTSVSQVVNTSSQIPTTAYTSSTSTSSSNTVEPTTITIEPSVLSNNDDKLGRPPDYAIAVIAILAFLLVVFVAIIFIVIFLHFYPRHVIGAMSVESDGTPTCTLSTDCGDLDDNMYHKDAFEGTTSGSGSGLPLLIQRSVAAQVTLKEVIGKGRFGEVRRGTYKGDQVAVKIFHTKEESSWCHEVDIYQTCLIRHPNILRFIAADNKDVGVSIQLWLITEFCDNGSLYDVLQQGTLSEDTVLKLCYTAACGLAHLHSDIIGTEGKPAIAHRDIKTRNILVKSDFCCCLADLGLSLRYYRETDKVEEPPTKRVGTRRYLSPEILNDTMSINNFDSFKRSDIYSFGLVMWEVARRGLCCETSEDYRLPYFDLVNPDPTFEDMKKVVAVEKKRPTIPNRWNQSEVFHSLTQLMEQCWHHDGEARVTALRVKKNLSSLQTMKCKQKIKTPLNNEA